MTLDECMERHTYRQYQAWLAWLSLEELERTTPDQMYLAQIASEIRKLLVLEITKDTKQVDQIKVENFILKEKAKPRVMTYKEKLAQATVWAKARWAGLINMSKKK